MNNDAVIIKMIYYSLVPRPSISRGMDVYAGIIQYARGKLLHIFVCTPNVIELPCSHDSTIHPAVQKWEATPQDLHAKILFEIILSHCEMPLWSPCIYVIVKFTDVVHERRLAPHDYHLSSIACQSLLQNDFLVKENTQFKIKILY